jgi:hypothetical protein
LPKKLLIFFVFELTEFSFSIAVTKFNEKGKKKNGGKRQHFRARHLDEDI